MSQSLAYLTAAATTAATLPTVAPAYSSRQALDDALGSSQAIVMEFGNTGDASRNIRALLSAGILGDENETAEEALYLITALATSADASPAESRLLIEPIGTLTWTAGATAVLGGRSGEKLPKGVSVAGEGRLAGRTGVEMQLANAAPAVVTIYDIGPATGLLRVPRVGTATGVSLMGATWR